jgi:hypothetical protein
MKGYAKKSRFLLPRLLLLGILFLLPVLRGTADNIRGKVIEVSLIGNGEAPSSVLPLKLEENWGILLSDHIDLLRGVEIAFDLPEQADIYSGTYAVFVYDGVTPRPDKTLIDYQGTLLFFKPVEGGKKLFIQLPLESMAGFGTLPDTYTHRKPLSPGRFPLMITILPIMKGIPDRAARAVFHAQVRPLFKNLGKIALALTGDFDKTAPENVRIFIDDKNVPYNSEGFAVEPGIRKIRVEIPGFTTFVASVGIDRGKTSRVEARFERNTASVRIDAPAGARAFLDGEAVDFDKKEIILAPGEHTLSFKVGDYQISKRFHVQGGKSYGISLFLDILINED